MAILCCAHAGLVSLTKNKKTKIYGENQYKIITGCVINPNGELKVKNSHKKKIIEKLKLINGSHSAIQRKKIINSVLGLISYTQQLEKGSFSS